MLPLNVWLSAIRHNCIILSGRSLGDYEQAGDVLQFVFMQLYISLPKLSMNLSTKNTATPLKSWLFQVAWNRCMDELRRQRPLFFSELEISDEADEGISFLNVIPDTCPSPRGTGGTG